jgi:hypothetical protein
MGLIFDVVGRREMNLTQRLYCLGDGRRFFCDPTSFCINIKQHYLSLCLSLSLFRVLSRSKLGINFFFATFDMISQNKHLKKLALEIFSTCSCVERKNLGPCRSELQLSQKGSSKHRNIGDEKSKFWNEFAHYTFYCSNKLQ